MACAAGGLSFAQGALDAAAKFLEARLPGWQHLRLAQREAPQQYSVSCVNADQTKGIKLWVWEGRTPATGH